MKPELVKNSAYKMVMERDDGFAYKSNNGLIVIQSLTIESDGKPCLHTSFSRKSRIPDYDDMTRIKRDFIGDDKKAIMILPDKEHHVNIHQFCLHFFTCLESDELPEFSGNGSI